MSSPFALRCAVKLLPMMSNSTLRHVDIEDVIDKEIIALCAPHTPEAMFISWLVRQKQKGDVK